MPALLLADRRGSLIVPWLSPYDYSTPQLELIFAAPMLARRPPARHRPAGARPAGARDLGLPHFAADGLAASLISVLIGVLWGATAGYLGGRVDAYMMRIVDVLYSVPFIPLVIVLRCCSDAISWLMFVAIGAVSWLDIARIVRGQTLSTQARRNSWRPRARSACAAPA